MNDRWSKARRIALLIVLAVVAGAIMTLLVSGWSWPKLLAWSIFQAGILAPFFFGKEITCRLRWRQDKA